MRKQDGNVALFTFLLDNYYLEILRNILNEGLTSCGRERIARLSTIPYSLDDRWVKRRR